MTPSHTPTPLIAFRPHPSRPDTEDDISKGDNNPGVSWRYLTMDGDHAAVVYQHADGGWAADFSSQNHTIGLNGRNVGMGLPPLPLTRDADAIGPDKRLCRDVDTDTPLTRAQIQAEVEAQLVGAGWTIIDRSEVPR